MRAQQTNLLTFALGLVIGALAVIYTHDPRTQCPDPPPTQAAIDRIAERDSINRELRLRTRELDSLKAITPAQRHDRSIRIVRSLSRAHQYDSLLADPY